MELIKALATALTVSYPELVTLTCGYISYCEPFVGEISNADSITI